MTRSVVKPPILPGLPVSASGNSLAHDAAQVVATVSFDNHMHVFASLKANPQTDDQFGIGDARAQVFLGDDGINLHVVRFEFAV